MSRIQLVHGYRDIISLENLLEAWREFRNGKRARCDVQIHERNLMGNIIALHNDLVRKTYKHSAYEAFNISDPKPRSIHKASVRDRLLPHALYRILYPFFDRTFIADSFSCRVDKGTHKAMDRFRTFANKVSENHTKTAWVLKCDIKQFFASVDHSILKSVLTSYIPDKDILWLLSQIVDSFETSPGVGLPLGNLTSQLFVNIYMNQFDQFMKHALKAKYYIRYTDDFVIFSQDQEWLQNLIPIISTFLTTQMKLRLHPRKVSVNTVASGVDFLGWVHFSDHRVMRTVTKRKMMKRINENAKNERVQSYLGILSHGNEFQLKQKITQEFVEDEQ